jgi:hypothetical protein
MKTELPYITFTPAGLIETIPPDQRPYYFPTDGAPASCHVR